MARDGGTLRSGPAPAISVKPAVGSEPSNPPAEVMQNRVGLRLCRLYGQHDQRIAKEANRRLPRMADPAQ